MEQRRWRTGRAVAVAVALAAAVAGCSGGDEATTTTAAPTTTVDDGTSGELLLLSYNVAGLPQEVSEVEPKEHIPLIAPLLEDYDVVLTQEDFDWWDPDLDALDFVNYHERLRAEATHEYRTERHPGPEAVGIDVEADRPTLLIGDGLGVLSRYPLGEVARVPWDTCFGGADTSDGGAADCLAMKGFLVTTLELAPGVEVVVVDLHAEAGGKEPDRRASHAGFRQLAAYLQANHPDEPLLLLGDTNLHTEEGREPLVAEDGEVLATDREVWLELLEATGLTDVCDLLECEDAGRIDKAALRSGGGVELEPVERSFAVERFVDAEGEPLSDHDPLVLRVAWRAAG